MNNLSQLEDSIKAAQEAYHNGEGIMDDDEYDALLYSLSLQDADHPLITKVGSEPNSEWKKHKHLFPMGSLNKVNTPAEMEKFITSAAQGKEILVTEKLDGLSIGCEYKNGELTHAPLRGGGSGSGEDILSNALKMKGCVKSIPGFTGVLRGEIVLLKDDHQKHFSDYSNPRNAASGLCRRFDGEGAEHLTLMFYQVLGQDFGTEQEQIDFLIKAGVILPNYKLCQNAAQVSEMWQEYQDKTRESLNYEIDGLVVSVNNMARQKSLGENNLRPKGKMAFKFANQMVKSTITEIIWETGSMGRVTPVCWIEPVSILGSVVQKASIYNIAYIQKLGLDVGAEVLFCKAGEIIPRLEKVTKGTGTVASIPEQCPRCDFDLEMDGEYLVCLNTEVCPAQIEGRIKNWVKELDILEVGDGVIEKLVSSGLVITPADLYLLTVKELSSLERMGEKSAKNVHDSIWKKNPITLDVFLGGLSIPMIGKASIKLLMDSGYDTLAKIQGMSQEEMEAIKGMGPARSQSLYDGLAKNEDIIMELIENGVKIEEKKEVVSNGKLAGVSFCFTGAMQNKRKVLQQMVLDNGGINKDSVNKDLTYLVIEDHSTTKAAKALKLDIKLLSEQEFLAMVQ